MAIAARDGGLEVSLRFDFDYPVRFTRDAFASGNPGLLHCLRRRERFARHRVLFLFDASAAERAAQAQAYADAHKGSLCLAAPALVASEQALERLPEAAGWLRARMAAAGLGELSHVVAVGGEALQNAAGFAAATLRPAPRLTRMPTSALGQIGWGGRTESSLGPSRARCAARTIPFAVINDGVWLERVSPEARAAALAEAARLALSQDASLFHWLAERTVRLREGEPEALSCAVRWAARLAADRSTGFGEWSAGLLPRPAALGLDCLLSREACGLPAEAARAALAFLRECGLKLWEPGLGRVGRVAAELARTAPAEGVVLLAAIGQAKGGIPVEEDALERAAGELRRGLAKTGGGRK